MNSENKQQIENEQKLIALLKEKSSNRCIANVNGKLTLFFNLGDKKGILEYKEGLTIHDMTPELQELFQNYVTCEYCGKNTNLLTKQDCNCPNCDEEHLICYECESA